MHDMNNDIAKVLISEEQLQAKVAELGHRSAAITRAKICCWCLS